jgi:hypothetical protein
MPLMRLLSSEHPFINRPCRVERLSEQSWSFSINCASFRRAILWRSLCIALCPINSDGLMSYHERMLAKSSYLLRMCSVALKFSNSHSRNGRFQLLGGYGRRVRVHLGQIEIKCRVTGGACDPLKLYLNHEQSTILNNIQPPILNNIQLLTVNYVQNSLQFCTHYRLRTESLAILYTPPPTYRIPCNSVHTTTYTADVQNPLQFCTHHHLRTESLAILCALLLTLLTYRILCNSVHTTTYQATTTYTAAIQYPLQFCTYHYLHC